jgi:outer membrane lipoprotein SlyB
VHNGKAEQGGAMKKIQSIDDLQFDDHNANKGTATGQKLVAKSIEDYGAGRSIVADKHGTVIGGNKTLQAARDAGLDVEVIRTSGDKLIVHQREDLSLVDGDKARLLAYADNRSSEIGLDWDAGVLTEDIEGGLDLGDMFGKGALDDIMGTIEGVDEPEVEFSQELMEEHNYIVFYFDNGLDWSVASEGLGIKRVKSHLSTNPTIGQGRVLKGGDLLKIMNPEIYNND